MRAILSLSLLLTVPVYGQSALPPCGSDIARVLLGWNECFGTYEKDGHKYTGEWKKNTYSGQGGYSFPNGNVYVGSFEDGKANGYGTFHYLADNQYRGMTHSGWFLDWKAHGEGTLTSCAVPKSASCASFGAYTFVGNFKDGKRQGRGTTTFVNGDKFEGDFFDGNSAVGTFTAANGDKFIGELQDDKRRGYGIATFADGRPAQEGRWWDGKLVREMRIPDRIAGRPTTESDLNSLRPKDIVSQPAAAARSNLDLAREKCGVLGLKAGTEKFGECVLRLSK